MATEVRKCNCKNTFQDKEYGDGQRVHNTTLKDELRCTVCGNIFKERYSKK